MPIWLTDPGDPTRGNEDVLWFNADVGIVLDGVGRPDAGPPGCSHSVRWYVERLANQLGRRLGEFETPLRQALAAAIDDVADLHRQSCDLSFWSPSATLAAWRVSGEYLECLVLCDASLLLTMRGGVVTLLTDDRIDDVVAARLAGADGSDGPTSGNGARRRDLQVEASDSLRNVSGGFWCARHEARAAEEAITLRLPISAVRTVIAASDGATRAFRDLGTRSVASFAQACDRGELEVIRDEVRGAERAQASRLRRGGHKIHDDLTILVANLS